MEERKGNRKYDKQYKEEAIRLVTEGGRKVTEAARSLGIHESLLRTWKQKYKEDPAGSFPGKWYLKPQDEEFRKLQKENINLKEDKEILKKPCHLLKTPQMKYWFMIIGMKQGQMPDRVFLNILKCSIIGPEDIQH